jgi:hypothetical protein
MVQFAYGFLAGILFITVTREVARQIAQRRAGTEGR